MCMEPFNLSFLWQLTRKAVLLILLWFPFTAGSLCFLLFGCVTIFCSYYITMCVCDIYLVSYVHCEKFCPVCRSFASYHVVCESRYFCASSRCLSAYSVIIFHDHTCQNLYRGLGLLGFYVVMFPCNFITVHSYNHDNCYRCIYAFKLFLQGPFHNLFILLKVYIFYCSEKRLTVACNIKLRRLINFMH